MLSVREPQVENCGMRNYEWANFRGSSPEDPGIPSVPFERAPFVGFSCDLRLAPRRFRRNNGDKRRMDFFVRLPFAFARCMSEVSRLMSRFTCRDLLCVAKIAGSSGKMLFSLRSGDYVPIAINRINLFCYAFHIRNGFRLDLDVSSWLEFSQERRYQTRAA